MSGGVMNAKTGYSNHASGTAIDLNVGKVKYCEHGIDKALSCGLCAMAMADSCPHPSITADYCDQCGEWMKSNVLVSGNGIQANANITLEIVVRDSFILNVSWDPPKNETLPAKVGPFGTYQEAEDWAKLNIPNGTYEIQPLSWPYQAGGMKLS